jgi:hypothetical protein
MAVFVAASDENAGQNQRERFFLGGWLAPEDDWSRFFAPAWQERVLDGPPRIPYLHMTDIRSSGWRAERGLSRLDADGRIDAAITLIDGTMSLLPIVIDADAGHFRDQMKGTKIVVKSGAAKNFEPDYICFLGYAFHVLNHLEEFHPEAEKVDFVVEVNGEITKHIQEFHSHFPADLQTIGRESLIKLVGELIPAGKDRIPLQAADVLCWHIGRARQPETMDADDVRRYQKLTRRQGIRVTLSEDMIEALRSAVLQRAPNKHIRIGQ